MKPIPNYEVLGWGILTRSGQLCECIDLKKVPPEKHFTRSPFYSKTILEKAFQDGFKEGQKKLRSEEEVQALLAKYEEAVCIDNQYVNTAFAKKYPPVVWANLNAWFNGTLNAEHCFFDQQNAHKTRTPLYHGTTVKDLLQTHHALKVAARKLLWQCDVWQGRTKTGERFPQDKDNMEFIIEVEKLI